jgi:signal transduction histidine kinase
VLDEGPGLAAGEETRLFERFARGSAGSGRGGTGLGLAIVDTLAPPLARSRGAREPPGGRHARGGQVPGRR